LPPAGELAPDLALPWVAKLRYGLLAGLASLILLTHYVFGLSLRLDAGIENLTGRKYALPLGGRYWVGDKTGNSSVPGMGRSIYSGLTFQF
jgi:hypothetical protein